jgi:signal transduction histidine kinase
MMIDLLIEEFKLLKYLREFLSYDKLSIDKIKERYALMKSKIISSLYLFTALAYIIIANGYYNAHYYYIMIAACISLVVLVVIYLHNRGKQLTANRASFLFVYLPGINLVLKDIFFLINKNVLINEIFLHSHFILVLLISLSGLIVNHRHILFIGSFSVVWICGFTVYSGDSFLLSLILLDSVFFIAITLILYFVHYSIHVFIMEIHKLGQTITTQNEELIVLSDFKERVFNMIIHDIKNPVSRILAASKMDVIERDEIVEPTKHILLIVQNVLDVFKIEDSKIKLRLSTSTIDHVIVKAIEHVGYLLVKKRITLHKQITGYSTLEIDVDLMERVIINLLTNAIKYSKPNSIVTIHVKYNNGRLRVEVIDEGEGVAQENIDLIFDKYYQVNSKGSDVHYSTGLGLTFCKLIVETHGGVIGAESQLNKGLTVWFELPVELKTEMTSGAIIEYSLAKYELDECDNKLISHSKKKISHLLIYQTSELIKLLNDSSDNCSLNFTLWKEEIITASMMGNVEYFNVLKKL